MHTQYGIRWRSQIEKEDHDEDADKWLGEVKEGSAVGRVQSDRADLKVWSIRNVLSLERRSGTQTLFNIQHACPSLIPYLLLTY